MLHLQADANYPGSPRRFWVIDSDDSPSREMCRKLRSDYCEGKMNRRGHILSSLIVFLGVLVLLHDMLILAIPCLILAFIIATGCIGLNMRKSVKAQERARLAAYLSDNCTKVASLDGVTGTILTDILAGRNIAIASLSSPESRLVDEYFARINAVELDSILSTEGADTNPRCKMLRRKLMERADRVSDAIHALRRDVAAANARMQQIVQDDLGDRAAGVQAQLTSMAERALESI